MGWLRSNIRAQPAPGWLTPEVQWPLGRPRLRQLVHQPARRRVEIVHAIGRGLGPTAHQHPRGRGGSDQCLDLLVTWLVAEVGVGDEHVVETSVATNRDAHVFCGVHGVYELAAGLEGAARTCAIGGRSRMRFRCEYCQQQRRDRKFERAALGLGQRLVKARQARQQRLLPAGDPATCRHRSAEIGDIVSPAGKSAFIHAPGKAGLVQVEGFFQQVQPFVALDVVACAVFWARR